jgi:BNR repeat protein
MKDYLTRRGLFQAVGMTAASALYVGGHQLPEPGRRMEHDIVIRTSDPFSKFLEAPYAGWFESHREGAESLGVLHRVQSYKAEYKVRLPWQDDVHGNADPFIADNGAGEIYATTATAITMMKSADGGLTWQSFKLELSPPLQPPDPALMAQGCIQAFAILRDGTFLLAYQVGPNMHVARSSNGGETWNKSATISPPHYEFAGGVTHGAFLELPDGTVLLPVSLYSVSGLSDDVGASELSLFRSSDGGRTWGNRTRVCFFAWESSLLRLPSGRLLIAVRSQRGEGSILPTDTPELSRMAEQGYPKQVYLADSDNAGRTWKNWRKATVGVFDAPGELVRMPDGRLVLLYAHRAPDPPPCGTWAMVSSDGGLTWNVDQFVVNSVCEHRPFDWGYSATLVMPDQSLLTLSGCRGEGWPNKPGLNQRNPGAIFAVRWRVSSLDDGNGWLK